MREIDDRYPEFAEPNEPVKKVKHRKGVTWSLPAVAGVFVLTVALMNAPGEPSPVIPPGPPEPPEVPEPRIVTVAIDVESEEETYSGEEFEITPRFEYTAMEADSDVTDQVTVELKEGTVIKATDAGEYPFDLSADSFDITADDFDECEVVVNDGTLKIAPAKLVVAISGNTGSAVYDTNSHGVSGYSMSSDRDDYTDSDLTFSGNASAYRTVAGTTYMGLSPDQFTNENDNFDVTFDVTDGYIQISRAVVSVSITGSTGSAVYDGSSHSVSGYDAVINNGNYTRDRFSFSGSAFASRTEVGTTYMGLSSSQFTNLDDNFTVQFSVTDGYIEITEPEIIVPKVTDLEVEDNVNLDMVMFARVSAKIDPGELSQPGGSIKAWVHVKNDTSGNFERDTEYPFTYEGDGSSGELYIDVLYRMPEDMWLVRKTGKLVIEYTYPDGKTGTYESEEFYMYKGTFVVLNTDYGEDGVLVTGSKLEVDLLFEQETTFQNGGSITVLPENVVIDYGEAYVSVYDSDDNYVEDLSKYKEMPDETEFYTDEWGTIHMHLTYYFTDDVVPTGAYTVYPGFYGEITDKASGWNALVW